MVIFLRPVEHNELYTPEDFFGEQKVKYIFENADYPFLRLYLTYIDDKSCLQKVVLCFVREEKKENGKMVFSYGKNWQGKVCEFFDSINGQLYLVSLCEGTLEY